MTDIQKTKTTHCRDYQKLSWGQFEELIMLVIPYSYNCGFLLPLTRLGESGNEGPIDIKGKRRSESGKTENWGWQCKKVSSGSFSESDLMKELKKITPEHDIEYFHVYTTNKISSRLENRRKQIESDFKINILLTGKSGLDSLIDSNPVLAGIIDYKYFGKKPGSILPETDMDRCLSLDDNFFYENVIRLIEYRKDAVVRSFILECGKRIMELCVCSSLESSKNQPEFLFQKLSIIGIACIDSDHEGSFRIYIETLHRIYLPVFNKCHPFVAPSFFTVFYLMGAYCLFANKFLEYLYKYATGPSDCRNSWIKKSSVSFYTLAPCFGKNIQFDGFIDLAFKRLQKFDFIKPRFSSKDVMLDYLCRFDLLQSVYNLDTSCRPLDDIALAIDSYHSNRVAGFLDDLYRPLLRVNFTDEEITVRIIGSLIRATYSIGCNFHISLHSVSQDVRSKILQYKETAIKRFGNNKNDIIKLMHGF